MRTDEAFALEQDAADPHRTATRSIPSAGRPGRIAADLPRGPIARRPTHVGAGGRRGRTGRVGRFGRARPFPRRGDLGLVRRTIARTNGPPGRGAARRDLDAQHADREPAPVAGLVLQTGRPADEAPHRCADVPIGSVRGRVAAHPSRAGPRGETCSSSGRARASRIVRTEDLEAAIHDNRDALAVALLAGVNYATGQVHDVARLTAAVHEAGALAGWQLAHSAGNVPLALHDWDVDFAMWCTYKYLCAGPRIDRPDLREPPARFGSVHAPAVGLVRERARDPIPDGRDVRPGAGRRWLADVQSADPGARAGPRLDRDLRRGRDARPPREDAPADAVPGGPHRCGRGRGDRHAAGTRGARRAAQPADARMRGRGWIDSKPPASWPTSASPTSSVSPPSRCTTRSTTPGDSPRPSRRPRDHDPRQPHRRPRDRPARRHLPRRHRPGDGRRSMLASRPRRPPMSSWPWRPPSAHSPAWSATPAAERSRILVRLADALEARMDDFVRAESIDSGKPVKPGSVARHPAGRGQPAVLRDRHPAHRLRPVPDRRPCPQLHAAPPPRRGRAHLPVEPAAVPVHLEDRPGHRDRQYGRRQAVRTDAVDRGDAGRAQRRGRACRPGS